MADLRRRPRAGVARGAPRARRRAGRGARPAALQGHARLGVHRPRQARPGRRSPRPRPARATRAPPSASRPLLEAPEGAVTLGQVDGRVLEDADAVEDGPVVLPLTLAVERHPELVEPHLGTLVAGDQDVFTAAQRRELDRRRVRLRPARRARRRADPADRDHGRRGHGAAPPHADRARGGRRGRGVGAVPVRLRGRRDAAQHRRRARRRPERAPALRLRAGHEREVVDLRHPARRGRPRRRSSTGPRSASARRAARCGMETLLAGQGADAKVTGAYAPHAPPAPRLRHHAGARRAQHDAPTSPSAASWPTARPRSGAG